MMNHIFLLSALSSLFVGLDAFTTPTRLTNGPSIGVGKLYASNLDESSSPIDSFVEDVKVRFRILQESNASGADFKQTVANVIAGEYDEASVSKTVEEMIGSAPCVMFTWEKSPSCVKAVEAFDLMGAEYKIVRLDDPWSEGNPIRAALGKKVGRTSVPFIFIGGKYVGGYDGGLSDDAPGIVNMAFQGKLRSSLEDVGALTQKKVEKSESAE
mmetsp:Transcript_6991/g.8711  ORF Transcript_6991/g.8711 Transcript_6991/m.8711 type:complete len:213 (-) Transcript_6991:80-718(-)